jgi:hypothetical protein
MGSVLFSFLYFIATLYYPGGTYLDKTSSGFSWTQNYWCNLLDENAINGELNQARPFAFAAMGVLNLTLISFWYSFPKVAGFKRNEQYAVQLSGFLSMLISYFVFTTHHDAVINVAGFFGLIALAGTLIGLRKLKWNTLFYCGLFAAALIALNNLLYYRTTLMYYLPAVQKLTFLYFVLWISLINLRWYRKPAR